MGTYHHVVLRDSHGEYLARVSPADYGHNIKKGAGGEFDAEVLPVVIAAAEAHFGRPLTPIWVDDMSCDGWDSYPVEARHGTARRRSATNLICPTSYPSLKICAIRGGTRSPSPARRPVVPAGQRVATIRVGASLRGNSRGAAVSRANAVPSGR